MKVCTVCGVSKPLSMYSPNAPRHGLRADCKPCNAAKQQARRVKNPILQPWTNKRTDARRRGLQWSLPRALYADLVTDACFYCGAAPRPRNTIDRVDNTRGYVEGNVVTACLPCNQAKHTLTREQFEAWGIRLGRHLARHAPAA